MNTDTVIFDMDGLLIDSEPLWYEAAQELLKKFNTSIDEEDYNKTTGLRTPEFLHHWFSVFGIDHGHIKEAEADIVERVIKKVQEKGQMMKGVESALKLFAEHGFKIGLASSSPFNVIEAVLAKTSLSSRFEVLSSAEHLPYGKPNPQVFLDCANALNSHPTSCICIEDSFNGLIAAKAARMKCVIVPHPAQFEMDRWNIADLKLKSLDELTTTSLTLLLK